MGHDTLRRNLAELVAARRNALEAGDRWTRYSDIEACEAFAQLETLQDELLGADFTSSNSRLIALDLLLDGDDHPNFADDFKNNLFRALHVMVGGGDSDDA